ncbi:RNase adapter RapZ [Lujinxingia litoralis]|uniref:RNase adapter RapZ n=1 Tax=Lujinxingia litoralis TaxID=2211119 RepID=A0A328C3L3_9DELT|nr:RNase adapter RapZ [Lujinxingia litoralis]RAL20411.1 RNase adapter RapZ [Lujinxingia litoralis]
MTEDLEERSDPSFGAPRVVIVTGLSGSGKSTAIRALEDLGYFCIDNLPVPLLPKVLELAQSGPSRQEWRRLAFVVDTRDHVHLDQANATIKQLRDEGIDVQVAFLEAADEVLVRRFSETRRRHPVAEARSVPEGIALERRFLDDLRARADVVIDTSSHTVHTLKALIQKRFSSDAPPPFTISVLSFGFKYGLPIECDLVFDLRFLPNPYFVEELRPKTGLDADVQHYVLGLSEASTFLGLFQQMAEFTLPMYEREGKSYLTIGIGCTGGQHRSVAIAETIARRLTHRGWNVSTRHRDLERKSR